MVVFFISVYQNLKQALFRLWNTLQYTQIATYYSNIQIILLNMATFYTLTVQKIIRIN